MCLVTEVGTADGGALNCAGAFPYTRRLCVCSGPDDADNAAGQVPRDEL
jgi:hypothetical protein